MNECKHDWRINPHFMYANGQAQAMCVVCGAVKPHGDPWRPLSNNPRDWPKAKP